MLSAECWRSQREALAEPAGSRWHQCGELRALCTLFLHNANDHHIFISSSTAKSMCPSSIWQGKGQNQFQ